MAKGNYIVIEGLDGSGKSTQHELLLKALPNVIGVREPGGTPMSEALRLLVKDKSLNRAARTNSYLFSAARADLIDTIIRPAVQKGTSVIADRNWLSTIAYQTAEGVDIKEIEQLASLATQEFFHPDVVLFINTSPAECKKRLQGRGDGAGDYFDHKGLDYFERVQAAYLKYGQELPHFIVIDGDRSVEAIAQTMTQSIKDLLTTQPTG